MLSEEKCKPQSHLDMNPANYNYYPEKTSPLVPQWHVSCGINHYFWLAQTYSMRRNPYLGLLKGPKICS